MGGLRMRRLSVIMAAAASLAANGVADAALLESVLVAFGLIAAMDSSPCMA
jgi:hypothetical protein